MSTFEQGDYQWRETYFVFFDPKMRPQLTDLVNRLKKANSRYEIRNTMEDDGGKTQSLTLVSKEDHSAIDISYIDGEEVTEQAELLIAEFKPRASDDMEKRALNKLKTFTARFDILHFEHLPDSLEESLEGDELDEMLDPSALLAVIQSLVVLTKGLGIDPQSGELYTGDA